MTVRAPEQVDDRALLRSYAERDSQDAFASIVGRYVDLVYSTSLRRTRDRHLAEDATQAVFLILVQKARRLSPQTILAGWLYQTAGFVSKDIMKRETRRKLRERAA